MKVVNVVGARPNFIKVAPLMKEMRRCPQLLPVLIHTGQHYDAIMSEQFFTDAMADFLFVTEESGWQNLLREGIEPGKIHFVGNVMIDALQMFRPKWEHSSIFKRLALDPDEPYGVLTLHRPSNVDDPVILT